MGKQADALKDQLRDVLIDSLRKGIEQAYAAAQALVHLRSVDSDNPNMIGNEDILEKAREQAISRIVDTQNNSGRSHIEDHAERPDDNGQAVSDYLQSALMIAVMLKSDILDGLDNQPEQDEPVKSTQNPRDGRLVRHILQTFKGQPFGHFMTIAQICDAITPEYPTSDDRPASGAIIACLSYGRKRIESNVYNLVIEFRHKVENDFTSPKGAHKVRFI